MDTAHRKGLIAAAKKIERASRELAAALLRFDQTYSDAVRHTKSRSEQETYAAAMGLSRRTRMVASCLMSAGVDKSLLNPHLLLTSLDNNGDIVSKVTELTKNL